MSKLIIFDVDGTLLDARLSWVAAANKLRSINGLPEIYNIDNILKISSGGAKPLIDEISRDIGKLCEVTFWSYVYNDFSDLIDFFFDDKSFLSIRKNCEIVGFTNKSRSHLENILMCTGHSWGLDYILCSDDVPRKPSALGLALLAKRYNADLSDMLFVGDTSLDYVAAESAGVEYIHCSYGYDPEFVLHTHITTVGAPSELVKILEAKVGYLC